MNEERMRSMIVRISLEERDKEGISFRVLNTY